jgi:SAM-dependent methyltransferase
VSTPIETFQLSVDQARVYESRFVPAIFAQWAAPLVDAASVDTGQRVLDVGCGTGVLARVAAGRVGPTGAVTGVDLNTGMLTVAARLRPDLEWCEGDALALPFPDGGFDVVLCQSALMFFPDATRALREMARVCAPGGSVGVQVYGSLDAQPAYGPWVELVARHAGPDALSLLGAYWAQGDLDTLTDRFESAGLEVTSVGTERGTARWESVDEMVQVELTTTPLAGRIGDEVYGRILDESRDLLAGYRTPTGTEVPITAHLVVGRHRR